MWYFCWPTLPFLGALWLLCRHIVFYHQKSRSSFFKKFTDLSSS